MAADVTNVQLDQLARRMGVSYFIDIFMRNVLPTNFGATEKQKWYRKSDDATNTPGTHYNVCEEERVVYFEFW